MSFSTGFGIGMCVGFALALTLFVQFFFNPFGEFLKFLADLAQPLFGVKKVIVSASAKSLYEKKEIDLLIKLHREKGSPRKAWYWAKDHKVVISSKPRGKRMFLWLASE